MSVKHIKPLRASLIFSCSASKSCAAVISHATLGDNLLLTEAAEAWLQMLQEHKSKGVPAEKFYTGSGMNAIANLRPMLDNPHNVHIISNGSGLTQITENVVPYHFTTDEPDDPSSVHTHLREKFQKHIWWRLINQGWHGEANPLAKMLQDPKNDYVIVAVYKRHLKYIVHDLLTLEASPLMSKLRIITLGGSKSALPVRLHKYCLLYRKKFLDQMLGNRTDVPHRAAQHCLNYLTSLKVATSLDDQQTQLQQEQDTFLGETSGKTAKTTHEYTELLKQSPELLDTKGPDEAYAALAEEGSLSQFRLAWIVARGTTVKPKPETVDAAVAALSAIEGALQKLNKAAKPVNWQEEVDVLNAISTFVLMIREKPNLELFDIKTLFQWLDMFYSCRPEYVEKLPASIQTTSKVRKVLMTSLETLNIEVFKPENSSRIMYRVK